MTFFFCIIRAERENIFNCGHNKIPNVKLFSLKRLGKYHLMYVDDKSLIPFILSVEIEV
jgi:hypothetical protein